MGRCCHCHSWMTRCGCCCRCYCPCCSPPCCHYRRCFSSATGSESTVANATGKKVVVFYHKEQIKLEDLLTTKNTKKVFKPQAEMSYIELQPKQQLEIPSMEEGFASIFVADAEDSEVYMETISLNFTVPHGACFIVTAKKEVKFRKCDGEIWIDEDGFDHSSE